MPRAPSCRWCGMTDDHDKRAAFERLKDELREGGDAQEFLDLLRLSKRGQIDDNMVNIEARRLAKIEWKKTLGAGDDFIPAIQHRDYRVREKTLKLMLARMLRERRQIPRLLAIWGASYLDGPDLYDADTIEIDPEVEFTEEVPDRIARRADSTLCIWMLVRIGVRCPSAEEAGLTITRNEASPEHSICDAVKALLKEHNHHISYDGVVRCWQRGQEEYPDPAPPEPLNT